MCNHTTEKPKQNSLKSNLAIWLRLHSFFLFVNCPWSIYRPRLSYPGNFQISHCILEFAKLDILEDQQQNTQHTWQTRLDPPLSPL